MTMTFGRAAKTESEEPRAKRRRRERSIAA
jgi:hypothetical protein